MIKLIKSLFAHSLNHFVLNLSPRFAVQIGVIIIDQDTEIEEKYQMKEIKRKGK